MRTERSHMRRGQAMMEMAAGMFTLALVLGAIVAFALYISRAIELGKSARSDAGRAALNGTGPGGVTLDRSDKIEVDSLAAEYIFGSGEVPVKEKVYIPNMR